MILPLAFVYAATSLFWQLSNDPLVWRGPAWVGGLLKFALWVPTTLAITMWRYRSSIADVFPRLGLGDVPLRGLAWTAAASLPMAAIAWSTPALRVDAGSLLAHAALGPVAEEVLYRGFLFQQLWRHARWPWWAAATGSALVFSLAHQKALDEMLFMGVIYGDLPVRLGWLMGPLMTTVAAGWLLAWMTWRWRSLWPAIVAHGAMNFWWDLAPRGTTDAVAGAAQGLAWAGILAVTWWFTRVRTSDPDAASRDGSPHAG